MKIVITGTTGMVGEGVLLHCLNDPRVEAVLSVSRKSAGHQHPKLTELLVPDFMKLDAFDSQLAGYDACFYCAGISSVGLSEVDYTKITYDTPLGFARVLARLNPGMVLVHVSGRSTDSSEQGKVMWARVKGKTENALMKLPFKAVFNFRPALMKPVAGQKHVKTAIKALLWPWPLWKQLFPGSAMTLHEVANAMIHCVSDGAPKQVLEVADIQKIAGAGRQ
ncbi:MAG: NAD-dependent epimerase/dehydratase family protein [Myxococcaceae bacterium]|nr:NAD-dependent epimerase/dehydratase family protein [Myxococcaceae bacterium]